MRVLREGAFVADPFVYLADADPAPEGGDVIVSLSRYLAERDALLSRKGRLGVRLQSSDAPEKLAGETEPLAVIAVEFPKFVDGRGYTTGRLLRDRYHFTGELRAVGNVLTDQLFYMHRCGFDAYELEPGKDEAAAIAALQSFTVTYQAASDERLPLFRRRLRR
jgi:uncharacterized protein (DUF934 family)